MYCNRTADTSVRGLEIENWLFQIKTYSEQNGKVIIMLRGPVYGVW